MLYSAKPSPTLESNADMKNDTSLPQEIEWDLRMDKLDTYETYVLRYCRIGFQYYLGTLLTVLAPKNYEKCDWPYNYFKSVPGELKRGPRILESIAKLIVHSINMDVLACEYGKEEFPTRNFIGYQFLQLAKVHGRALDVNLDPKYEETYVGLEKKAMEPIQKLFGIAPDTESMLNKIKKLDELWKNAAADKRGIDPDLYIPRIIKLMRSYEKIRNPLDPLHWLSNIFETRASFDAKYTKGSYALYVVSMQATNLDDEVMSVHVCANYPSYNTAVHVGIFRNFSTAILLKLQHKESPKGISLVLHSYATDVLASTAGNDVYQGWFTFPNRTMLNILLDSGWPVYEADYEDLMIMWPKFFFYSAGKGMRWFMARNTPEESVMRNYWKKDPRGLRGQNTDVINNDHLRVPDSQEPM